MKKKSVKKATKVAVPKETQKLIAKENLKKPSKFGILREMFAEKKF